MIENWPGNRSVLQRESVTGVRHTEAMSILAALTVALMASVTEFTVSGAGGFQLAGVLELPTSGKAPYPCIMLMPGSGPTDRDGNQLPALRTDLLKDLSGEIRKSGIATVRFDKRPVGRYRAQWPTKLEVLDAFFSFENHIADAVSIYKWMKKRPEIDAKRLGILGHSEGGMIALEMTKSVSPNVLVLMGTPGRSMADVLTEQIEASLERSKAWESVKAHYMKSLREAIAALKADQPLPSDVAPGLRPLFNASTRTLLQGYFRYDGPALASRYAGPVLVMNGEKDIQISPTKDAGLLMKALEGRKDAKQTLFVSPKASHNFKVVESVDELGFEGPVEPLTTKTLVDWLKAELG